METTSHSFAVWEIFWATDSVVGQLDQDMKLCKGYIGLYEGYRGYIRVIYRTLNPKPLNKCNSVTHAGLVRGIKLSSKDDRMMGPDLSRQHPSKAYVIAICIYI